MSTLRIQAAAWALTLTIVSPAFAANRDVDGLAGRQAGAPGLTDRAFIEQAFRETQDDQGLGQSLKNSVADGVKRTGERIEGATQRRQDTLRNLADNRGIVLPLGAATPSAAMDTRVALERAIGELEQELQLYRRQAGQSETQPLQEFVQAELPTIEADLQIARREYEAHYPAGKR